MTASEKACLSQYKADSYPGIDNWQDSPLHKGNIIYVWEDDTQTSHNSEGVCAMTPQTALDCDGDPNALRDSIQTSLHPDYDTHRGVLRAYEANGDIDAAYSHCEANECHGKGGGEQYYVPNFDNHLEQGDISRREDLDLHFDKSRLPINKDEIRQNQIDIENQKEESPKQLNEEGQAVPKEGTTPTLDGAYTGETVGKGDELKPTVYNANEKWNNPELQNQTSHDANEDISKSSENGNNTSKPQTDDENQSQNNDYDYYSGIGF